MKQTELMTGNEAVARGCYEAGVIFASAYPGTPSTEILENIKKYKDDIYCEWAPNEKVATEAAIGASVAGARAIATMKHVGVNVAADPLFTAVYTGIEGGLVIVSADDPGMHSSQNEQDNRNYAVAAKCLMLEPSDSQEAKDFTKLAFELSERFDTPVLLRLTTRICHSKGIVTLEERENIIKKPYVKNMQKYVATPANAKKRRVVLEKRIEDMNAYSNDCPLNIIEGSGKVGVVTSGVSYQYAKEVYKDTVSYFKVGMSWPMPLDKIKEFAKDVEKLYVIEELDPYIENHLKMAGIECTGKEIIPVMGELNQDIIVKNNEKGEITAPPRPPSLCSGCPHRGIFHVLSKRKDIMISGDIGCYTLASAPPLSAMDTTICMGASISLGHGASKVFEMTNEQKRVVSVIGDSTFFHSGVTSLMDISYNNGNSIVIILDNRITGMTGHQENPGSGYTLMGEKTVKVDIRKLCESLGIHNIYDVNPLNIKETESALNSAMASNEASVIIATWPCAIKKFTDDDKANFDLTRKTCVIDQEKCKKCKICIKTGCPSILFIDDNIVIDKNTCVGCAVCMQVCPFESISRN